MKVKQINLEAVHFPNDRHVLRESSPRVGHEIILKQTCINCGLQAVHLRIGEEDVAGIPAFIACPGTWLIVRNGKVIDYCSDEWFANNFELDEGVIK